MEIKVIFEVASIVFACGMVYAELREIRKDIVRLEKKQEEANNVKIRTAKLETEVALLRELLHKVAEQVAKQGAKNDK